MQFARKTFSIFSAAGLLLQAAAPVMAQQTGQAESRIQVTSELVLVNVVAHDKKGNLVRDLKKGDFTLFDRRGGSDRIGRRRRDAAAFRKASDAIAGRARPATDIAVF